MGYGYGRRGGYSGRRTATVAPGRVAKANQRAGDCRDCGENIPAHGGQLYREESGAWSVVHVPAEWAGSPVSGAWTGGCPSDTDKLNTAGNFGAACSERDRVAAVAARAAELAGPPDSYRPARGSKYAYTNSGARVTMSSRRCEDAPCCGCCD